MTAKRKILVVDDKADIREFVQMVLEESGYEVLLAQDGEECLRLIAEKRPDMLITDVMMPKKSGFHMLQELRQRDDAVARMPVLVMTASMNVRQLFDEWKIEGFIQKPFTSADFLAKVEDCWKQRPVADKATVTREKASPDSLVLVAGEEGVVIDKIKSFVESIGHTVLVRQDENKILELAKDLMPEMILVQYRTGEEGQAAVRIYRRLLEDAATQELAFRAFCYDRVLEEASKEIPAGKILAFADISSLLEEIGACLAGEKK